MALIRYYIGNVGSGKSQKMYDRLLRKEQESLYDSESKKTILIVPEQYAMQAQENLLAVKKESDSSAAVVLSPKVYSFRRLAFEILDKNGEADLIQIDEIAKTMLIRILAKEQEKNEDFIVDCDRAANILGIKSVISEFEQYNIGSLDIEKVMSTLDEHLPDYKRLHFLNSIYAAYLNYIEEHNICFDVLASARTILEEKEIFRGAVIAFDEFNGFTLSQLSFIKELFHQAEELIFTLTIPEKSLLEGNISSYDSRLFFPAIRTYRDLQRQFESAKEEFVECKHGKTELSHLTVIRENFLRSERKEKAYVCDNVYLYESLSIDEEFQRVCEEIVYLTREKGYGYKEIAIVSAEPEKYQRYLNLMSELYRIPFLPDSRKPIDKNLISLFILDALEVIRTDFAGYSVIKFIKNPLADFQGIEEFENQVLKTGGRGLRFFEKLNKEDEEKLQGKEIIVRLQPLLDVFYKGKRRMAKPAAFINAAVMELINNCEMEKVLETLSGSLSKREKENLIRETEQTLDLIADILEKTELLFKEREVTIEEYIDIISTALSMSSIGDIPPVYDAVIWKDLMYSKHRKEYKAVFILGMNEGSLPVIKSDNGLFTDGLRQSFTEHELTLSDTLEQDLMIQSYELYRSLLMAKERLYLSAPKSDSLNEPLKPSYLLNELLGIVKAEKISEQSREYFVSRKACTDRAVISLIGELKADRSEAADTLYSLLKEKLPKELTAVFDYNSRVLVRSPALPKQLSMKLYEKKTFSITEMENFAGCAFAHFCKYALRLRERQLYMPNVMDYGQILHSSMEYVQTELKKEKMRFRDLSGSDIERLSKTSVTNAFLQSRLTQENENEYLSYNQNKILRMIKRAMDTQQKQMSLGDFELYSFEKEFYLPFDKDRTIRGVIDRIDTCRDMVRVIDYKSGKRNLDNNLLYYGLQLQLPLYLRAAMNLVKKDKVLELSPNGMFYSRLFDPVLEIEDLNGVSLEEERLKLMKLTGRFNTQREHILALDQGFASDDKERLAGGYQSLVVSAKTKKNGEFTATTLKDTTQSLNYIMDLATDHAKKITDGILHGAITVNPAVIGQYHACRYCSFSGLCGIDDRTENLRYLKNVKDTEFFARDFGDEVFGRGIM